MTVTTPKIPQATLPLLIVAFTAVVIVTVQRRHRASGVPIKN